ncbi:DEAD-box ATP-dependent RNA helicase 7 [Zea mays]|uniref:DEAD-box ATP-dependent RNA helicase 7 n=1 Tax=Zea mays TaxID=4577 RepID=A0A1D6P0S0_MAIZE|nr:DEAD-box ATP-dependent RNA helicase 7 [Zea mays]
MESRYKHSVSRLERESGVKFEHISTPQPTDVAQSAGSEAADATASVSDSVIPIFRQQAEQLLSSSSLSAADLLAKALAKAVLELTEICVLGLHGHKEKIIVIFLGGLQYTTSSNWQTDVVTWVCYNILEIVFLHRRFDVGNVVMVTGGRNTGRVGAIKNREKHKGIFEENIEWNSNLVVAKVWRLEFI